MPAWNVTRKWDDNEIFSYRQYVEGEATKRVGSARSTCEDLALRIAIEFASQRGLPLFFANDANQKPIKPKDYKTLDAYMHKVLPTTGARDLLNYSLVTAKAGTVVGDAVASFRKAVKGDMILLHDPVSHVQLITAVSPTFLVIVQGNFRDDRCIFVEEDDYKTKCYVGEIVKAKYYWYDEKKQRWFYPSKKEPEVFKSHGRVVSWDFDLWNRVGA